MDFATRVCRELRLLEYGAKSTLLLALVAPSAGRPYHDDRKTKHGHTCASRLLRARPLRRAPARL